MASASMDGLEVIDHPKNFPIVMKPFPRMAETTTLEEESLFVLIERYLMD